MDYPLDMALVPGDRCGNAYHSHAVAKQLRAIKRFPGICW